MRLADAFTGSPGSVCEAVDEPLSLGYSVVGLPPAWRRTRSDTVDDTPAASWIDSSVLKRHTVGGDSELVFVSVAMVMAWRVSGLGRNPIELAALFCGMTEEIPGWHCRTKESGSLGAASVSIRLLGTLDSPYGPLISNAHNVVYPSGADELIAIALTVTATPDGDDFPDRIALRGAQ